MTRYKALSKMINRSKLTGMVTRHENRARQKSRIYQIRNRPVSTNQPHAKIRKESKVKGSSVS